MEPKQLSPDELASALDTTKRELQRVEKERAGCEERLRSLRDKVPLGYQLLDENGNFLEVSQEWLRALGYSREEIIDKPFKDLVVDTDRHKLLIPLLGDDSKTQDTPFEVEVVSKDGSPKKMIVHGRVGTDQWCYFREQSSSQSERGGKGAPISEETARALEKIFSTTHFCFVLLDADFNFIRVNRAYADACGHDPEFFPGKNHFDLYPHQENEAIFRSVVESGKAFTVYAKPFEFPDDPDRGTTFWDWTLHPVKDPSGKVEGLVFALVDVTERKRAEEEVKKARDELELRVKERTAQLHSANAKLRQEILSRQEVEDELRYSEYRYRAMFENMRSGVAVYEPVEDGTDFVFKDFNRAAETISKVAREDVIGKRLLDIAPNMGRYGLLDGLRNVYRTGVPQHLPAFYYRDEYREGWREMYLYRLSNGEVVEIYDDITQRKQAEIEISVLNETLELKIAQRTMELEAVNDTLRKEISERLITEKRLRETEERFRTIFEQGPLGMAVVGLDYRFILLNPAFCSITGYSPADLGELTLLDLALPKDVEADVEQSERLFRGEVQHFTMEKRYLKKSGEVIWVSLTLSAVRDHDGATLYCLAMIQDITERRRMQDLLQRRAEELTRSNEDLEHFAYVASHDLQEPLRNVISCVQMLGQRYKGKLGPDADELIGYAVASSLRMKNLVSELLNYSRIMTKGKPLEATSSEQVLKEALLNLDSSIKATHALVTHDNLPLVTADVTQLLQIFQNLIGNALKFRREDPPRIHVSASKRASEWVFSVQDNGIGIEKDYFDKIFVLFQQLDKKAGPGTGIGLAVVKKIVERHGGRVWVESTVGQGSTFHFTIPVD
ncbi:MAG: PAS domain S-box protein [Thermodesulfobacteriota bacterium]